MAARRPGAQPYPRAPPGAARYFRRRHRRPAGFRPELDGVLSRPFAPTELADAVEGLLGAPWREVFVEQVRAGPFVLDVARRTILADEESVRLTPMETRLLRYLMERPGVPVSVDELLANVWGYYPGTGGSEIVRVHMRNVRRKMQQLVPGGEFVFTVSRVGYRFVADAGGVPS